jgi:hypothetical protein
MQTLFGHHRSGVRSYWISCLLVFGPIILVIVGWIAIKSFRGDASLAEREVQVFHDRIATEQYALIYNLASSDLRQQIDLDRFTQRLSTIRNEMGDCRPSQPKNSFVNANTSMTTVRQQYLIDCTNGTLQETFVYQILGKQAQLAGYSASRAFK